MRAGLDVGGTKTDAVAVDAAGAVVARVRLATGWGPDAVARTILDAVTALRNEPGVDGEAWRSVGIGIPGQIVPGTARVVHAVNLGVSELDLGRTVGAALGVPVGVENDVKAAALGAYALQGGAGSLAYLNLGTGVAAGVVAGGEVWRGAHGAAGEVGHISVDPAGPACRCGQRGCVEAFAGGGAIAARWGGSSPFAMQDVFAAAERGDALALSLRSGLARGVAAAVRILVLTADVDEVVVAGGIAAVGAPLLADVVDELRASAAASPFLSSLRLDERVRLLPAESPAAAVGAALVGAAGAGEVLARG